MSEKNIDDYSSVKLTDTLDPAIEHNARFLNLCLKRGWVTGKDINLIFQLTKELLEIISSVREGDEAAHDQLRAIYKFVFPALYDISPEVMSEVVNKYRARPALERGWAIRQMMTVISEVIKPARESKDDIFKDEVRLDPDKKNKKGYRIAAKSFKSLRRDTATLRALAINALQEGNEAFADKDEKSLYRDLREVEKWIMANGDEGLRLSISFSTWGYLFYLPYSETWRKRQRNPGSGNRKDVRNKKT
jgi:hypothetical protein